MLLLPASPDGTCEETEKLAIGAFVVSGVRRGAAGVVDVVVDAAVVVGAGTDDAIDRGAAAVVGGLVTTGRATFVVGVTGGVRGGSEGRTGGTGTRFDGSAFVKPKS